MEGQRLELDVETIAHGGHCVARHEGRVVFVRHALPGERVIARITDGTSESKFLRADAIEILDASPDRVEAPCRFSGPGGCGGCDFQHVALPAQRKLKEQIVRDQFQRLAKMDVDLTVEAVPGDEDGLRWRTRLELGVRHGAAGLREHRSHRLVEIDDCLIASPNFKPAYGDHFDHDVTGLDLVDPSVGDIVGIELPTAKDDVIPPVQEVVATPLGEREFEVSATGFWQVHPGAAPTFSAAVLEHAGLKPGETALDLYCGVGVFTRQLGEVVGSDGHVVGIEVDEEAVRLARLNMDGARHIDLIAGDVAAVEWGVSTADVVVLDPPRAGAGRAVMEKIIDLEPRTIVYVACDPAALARDVRTAVDEGFTLTHLRGYDAFPMTQHIECIAVLTRAAS